MDLPKKKWSSYVVLSKKEKTHPFDGESKDFLAVTTFSHALSKNIAKSVLSHNPGLELYDISHPLLLHYSAFHNLFIFCHLTFAYDEETKIIKSIESNNDRWDLEYNIPSLRTLNIKSKFNPKVSHQHKPIILEYEKQQININLANEDKAFHKIYNVIKEYDPDIILSDYGDNIIFPFLIKQLNRHYLKNIFSRDSSLGVKFINASSIESYGRVIHRKQQSLLFGRHHIDRKNMSFYTDLEIEIVFEIARISGMSLQEVSRSTPGRGIASLEIIEALKAGTCIPYRKQKPEIWRDAEKF
ncbi:MAG: hypothetical protein R2771_15985 [Saprospiraceae bacterium]